MTVGEYLAGKGLKLRVSGPQARTVCMFCGDPRSLCLHLETGQFQCHHCKATGNLHSIKRFYGED